MGNKNLEAELKSFYKGRKVLITGHTGFKGTWMCEVLSSFGADITGYALKPPTSPSLFELCGLKERIRSVEGDIRDFNHLKDVFTETRPEIVIHMAAQPIVRESYKEPVYTYDVNVMGTVNLMECIRLTDSVKSAVNVTTDKVYHNFERNEGYREEDVLGGFDPYSNSKSCSELVTQCYKDSFFRACRDERFVTVSTCRAGNVIGGGDFASDRILPDIVRAIQSGKSLIIRNPNSVRPYQHVLDPVVAYLIVAMKQYENGAYEGAYNIGPSDADCVTTGELTGIFMDAWKEPAEKYQLVVPEILIRQDGGPHEAGLLKLDSSKFERTFHKSNTWNVKDAVWKTAEWTAAYLMGEIVSDIVGKQVGDYFSGK